MSVPRLGFMDDFHCIFLTLQELAPMVIPLRKFTGAFWGQCLTRAIEELIEKEDPALIMTIDYDTVFQPQVVINLLDIMRDHPEVDAVAPIEMHRTEPRPLFSVKNGDGKFMSEVADDYFTGPIAKIHSAHMGCMIFRVDSLKKLKKPWFHSMPDSHGSWNGGHLDDDTWFWERWAEAGNTLYLSTRSVVGHAELMIRWPNQNFEFIDQHPSEFWTSGYPEGIWQ